jgi:hypothetical protein
MGIKRGEERPMVRINGRAREGIESISAALDVYVERLNKRFPGAVLAWAPGASGDKFTLDFTLFAPPAPADAAAAPTAQ